MNEFHYGVSSGDAIQYSINAIIWYYKYIYTIARICIIFRNTYIIN